MPLALPRAGQLRSLKCPLAKTITIVRVAYKPIRESRSMSDMEQRLAALEHRVGEMEDINAIRRLHWAYGYYIDLLLPDEVADLFAEEGVVVFLSGEYVGRAGVKRLYGDWIQHRFTGGRPGPVDGLLLDHFQMQDIITVAPDR